MEIEKEEEKVIKEPEFRVKTENIKNLFAWGGWKKELFWVMILGLLLFSAYSYKRDIELCRPYLTDPCSKCMEYNNATITALQERNIYLQKEVNRRPELNISKILSDGGG